METDPPIVGILNQHIRSLTETDTYDELLSAIGDARIVMIGEATHGTHEFYFSRAEITKRLIREKNFQTIAVEGDWPNVYEIQRYIQGRTKNTSAEQVLKVFKQFPTWMWGNKVILDFMHWLKDYNASLAPVEKINFYGMDLYSMHSSIESVIQYLKSIDPESAKKARRLYDCLDSGQFDSDREACFTFDKKCQDNLTKVLKDLSEQAFNYSKKDGLTAEDEYFSSLQNARLVKDGEEYYRSQLQGDVSSWNLRDTHMFQTVLEIKSYREQLNPQRPSKLILWAHNSHLGDARALGMSRHRQLNVGQLVKEHFGHGSFSIGYTTYTGTVTAASKWGGEAECKRIVAALSDSYENLFHRLKYPDFLLILKNNHRVIDNFQNNRYLERAIGVVYRPQTEKSSHYFYADLPKQFDALLHFDQTHALEPLTAISTIPKGEQAETYPFGV